MDEIPVTTKKRWVVLDDVRNTVLGEYLTMEEAEGATKEMNDADPVEETYTIALTQIRVKYSMKAETEYIF